MSLITCQSETANDAIIASEAYVVVRRLRGRRRWAAQPLNQISRSDTYSMIIDNSPHFWWNTMVILSLRKGTP